MIVYAINMHFSGIKYWCQIVFYWTLLIVMGKNRTRIRTTKQIKADSKGSFKNLSEKLELQVDTEALVNTHLIFSLTTTERKMQWNFTC